MLGEDEEAAQGGVTGCSGQLWLDCRWGWGAKGEREAPERSLKGYQASICCFQCSPHSVIKAEAV